MNGKMQVRGCDAKREREREEGKGGRHQGNDREQGKQKNKVRASKAGLT